MRDFVHLHLHTEYSLLDGAARIESPMGGSPLAEAVKARGMGAVAITDHGNLYGVFRFVKAMREAGIKAIIGSEFYTVADMRVRDPLEKRNHLVLLAKTDEGYRNLLRLSSLSFTEGFYYKPRIDMDLLRGHAEGLICLTGCVQGRIPSLILADNYEGAVREALELKELFGDDLYIELQDHGLASERRVLPSLVRLSAETGIKPVATNDVHYLEREDADMQDVLMCVSMKKPLSDMDRIKLETPEYYLKTGDEMYERFSFCEEALSNTCEIADKCDVSVRTKADPGHYEIPVYETPERYRALPGENGEREAAYLKDLAEAGIKKRYAEITPDIRERLDYELKTIIEMGFAGYYLIVWDFVNYSRNHGIPVGPGRGSGVGSLVAYAIGITDVDPIRYGLWFEKFLNPERVSMPDFDIDFCKLRREDVIEYVMEKYGRDRVAQIITYGSLAARQAVKDVARVYGVSSTEAESWAKSINDIVHITLSQALGRRCPALDRNADEETRARMISPDFIKLYDENPEARRVIDMAMRIENMPRHTGMHAAGVLICPRPVMDVVPVQKTADGIVTTQFDKNEVEALGLLKMDFLGLNTLTDIQLALDYAEETTGKRPDLETLDYADPNVFRLISDGDTEAVFQVERPGMRNFMTQLQPDSLEEIIAGVALYRPGPMQFIPRYIESKFHPETIRYLHPMLKNALEVTHGCIVYQEQVMQITREVAGYSFAKADALCKSIKKKKAGDFTGMRDVFINGQRDEDGNVLIEGAVARGMPEETASALFDQIREFSKYAFNKSHSTAYAVLVYRTAWLKRYYPLCFLAAILNNRITDAKEVKHYVNYLDSAGIRVLPPDINMSRSRFSIEGKNLRFGLTAIKNVGENAVEAVIAEREAGGPFRDLEDFILRTAGAGVSKRLVESLIWGGALDCFGKTRTTLLASYEPVMDSAARDRRHADRGQLSLFDGLLQDEDAVRFRYTEMPEYPETEKLMREKEVLGMYVSGHPLNSFRPEMERMDFNTSMIVPADALPEDAEDADPEDEDRPGGRVSYDLSLNGKTVRTGGILSAFSKRFTKKGDGMGTGVFEDLHGQMDFVVFPRAYDKYRDLLFENAIVGLKGELVMRDGEKPKLSVREVRPLRREDSPDARNVKIILRGAPGDVSDTVRQVRDMLRDFPGDGKAYFEIGGKLLEAPERVNLTEGLEKALRTIAGKDGVKVSGEK